MDVTTHRYRKCVGIMVLNPVGNVWIGRRVGSLHKNEGGGLWWQMPQGGIDEGEDPAQAARRELFEETGMRSVEVLAESADWYTYDLPPELRARAWRGRYQGQIQKWFAMRFKGPESEINLAARPGHEVEFDAWRWARLDELVDLVVPFKRKVYAQVLRDFAHISP
jgi:putative (di)nucleoside polyphosphate hydrolase